MIYTKGIFASIVGGLKLNNKPVFFQFGYWQNIHDQLLDYGKTSTLRGQRFPLIILHADFEETTVNAWTIRINPTFYIVDQSEQKYSIEKRIEDVYKPILYPIYKDFITAIRQSGKFYIDGQDIPHTRKDLYYLSSAGAEQNKLSLIVDAIEIKFSQLNMVKTQCYYK